MQILNISIEDQESTDKLLTFIKKMKNDKIKIVSQKEQLPISKNIPNKVTLKALTDTDYETVILDEFKDMCR
ncbi:hypothetical protein QUF74_03255 [Candidatus Halobeggiatoa sp. HSG11]|nr:hypothetical protein [Candidatus Halobeggiatoa sp. HSG11]